MKISSDPFNDYPTEISSSNLSSLVPRVTEFFRNLFLSSLSHSLNRFYEEPSTQLLLHPPSYFRKILLFRCPSKVTFSRSRGLFSIPFLFATGRYQRYMIPISRNPKTFPCRPVDLSFLSHPGRTPTVTGERYFQ